MEPPRPSSAHSTEPNADSRDDNSGDPYGSGPSASEDEEGQETYLDGRANPGDEDDENSQSSEDTDNGGSPRGVSSSSGSGDEYIPCSDSESSDSDISDACEDDSSDTLEDLSA